MRMRKARPLTDTAICVFKLFVGTRCEIDSNTRVVISSQNRFHGSTHISLVPNKVEFSQRVSIPGLGGDSHPFRFGFKDTVFIVKPFLKFNTCLIRLDSRNSHRQPHTQGIGKLNPRRISAVQQNIETGESITLPANQWSEYLVKSVWAVSGFGTVFSQHKQGFIPAVLTDWFNKRKQYKKLMKQFDGIDDDKSAYYDRLQYVYKIKLNSLYGALTNLYFRFYDLRMGESTTATGRNILKHQCRTVSLIMDGKYDVDFPLYETVDKAIKSGYTEEEARKIALHGPVFNGQFQSESVVYGDTDSVYFKTHAKDAAQAAQIADHIARRINESFPSFMQRAFKCAPGFDNIIAVNREIVSDNGIFVDKKRYIIHIVDSEGKTVDKMKTMGLDTKKTTLPAHVSSRLNGFIESFLTGTDWDTVSRGIVAFKRELIDAMKTDVRTIGLPKGINGIEDYSQRYKHDTNTRLPGHVAAAIHYNKCLEAFGDKQSPVIMSGMKIKVFYLLGDHGKFTSIALPTDIEMIPKWFLESFRVDIDKHIERLVDNPLTNILKAIDKRCPTEQSMLIDEAWAAVPAGAPLTEIDMWG